MGTYLPKRNNRIYEMKTKEKMTNKEIAEEMGISIARVSQILQEEYRKNLYRKPTEKAKANLQEIIRLYNGDVHPKDIALMYNVSDRFIRILLEKSGVYKKKKKAYPRGIEHFVLNSLSPQSEYFFGFVAGRGELDDTQLKIKHHDKETLVKLSSIVSARGQAKRNVYEVYAGEYEFRANSRGIINSVKSIGVLQEKKVYGAAPPGALLHSENFWRGYIDSRGKIGFDKDGNPFIEVKVNNPVIKEGLIMFLGNVVELSLDVKTNEWKLNIVEKHHLVYVIESLYLRAPKELRLARYYERALVIYEALAT